MLSNCDGGALRAVYGGPGAAAFGAGEHRGWFSVMTTVVWIVKIKQGGHAENKQKKEQYRGLPYG